VEGGAWLEEVGHWGVTLGTAGPLLLLLLSATYLSRYGLHGHTLPTMMD
jgi:hypothetical protein